MEGLIQVVAIGNFNSCRVVFHSPLKYYVRFFGIDYDVLGSEFVTLQDLIRSTEYISFVSPLQQHLFEYDPAFHALKFAATSGRRPFCSFEYTIGLLMKHRRCRRSGFRVSSSSFAVCRSSFFNDCPVFHCDLYKTKFPFHARRKCAAKSTVDNGHRFGRSMKNLIESVCHGHLGLDALIHFDFPTNLAVSMHSRVILTPSALCGDSLFFFAHPARVVYAF